MSSQSLSDRKLFYHFSKPLDRAPGVPDDAGTFQEIGNSQRRKEARRPICRQHVARACKVVAHHSRRIPANKNGAGVFDIVGDVLGFGHQHLDVLRRNVIHEVDRVLCVLHNKSDPVVDDRHSSNGASIQRFQLRLNLIENIGSDFFRPADQPHARHFIMLSLSKQICRSPRGITGFVGYDCHFTWPGDHIDVHNPVDLPLRGLHVLIPWPDDLLHLRNRFGPVSKSANRLRPSNAVHLMEIQECQRGSDKRIFFERPWGRHNDNSLDSRDLRRNNIHQHRRRICGFTTWNVNAGASDRSLAQP